MTVFARQLFPSMISTVFVFFCLSPSFGQAVSAVNPLGLIDERYGSLHYLEPCDILLDASGDFLFVLNAATCDLRKLSLIDEQPPVILRLDIRPERMAFTPDKKHIAIVGGQTKGRLLLVNAETLRIEKKVDVGHTPTHVTIFQSGDADAVNATMIAYVPNRFDGDISVIDLMAEKEITRWQAGREPIALEVTQDGKQLVVTGALPEDPMSYNAPRLRVRIFDTATGDVTVIPLFVGSMNARDLVISRDGRYAFLSCHFGHFEQIPMNIDGGWINENVLAAVDLETKTFADTIYLDEATHGAANPWGLAISDDDRFLIVGHAGSDEVALLNLQRAMFRLDNRPYRNSPGLGQYPHLVPRDTASTMPPCVRIPLCIKGMRQVAFDIRKGGTKGRIFCIAAYEDLIGRIDFEIKDPVVHSLDYNIHPDGPPRPKHLEPLQKIVDDPNGEVRFEALNGMPYQDGGKPTRLTFERLEPLVPHEGFSVERSIARLGPPVIWDVVRRGEVLFHDGAYCLQQWQSCISCHPDGRADGINWDLVNDGMNNAKNTKSLLYSHETPPSMASGVRADAETAVRAGVHGILFAYLPSADDYCAMDEFLKAMRPVPSPYLVDGQLSESAKRGKLLFNDDRTGCSVCHPESNYFTDLEKHDVGTQGFDFYSAYDTPTLIEVWRTAPYLHDGRYLTIRELIIEGKHYAPDGRLEKLTDEELDCLIEYVLSL